MLKMLDLAELASREPWWTTTNGKSVPHVDLSLEERDAIISLVASLIAERDKLKAEVRENINRIGFWKAQNAKLEAERDKLKEKLEGERKLAADIVGQCERAEAELVERVSVLREALKRGTFNMRHPEDGSRFTHAVAHYESGEKAIIHDDDMTFARSALGGPK